ncbi:hypothetical protein GLYMA_16G061900v4 [Glycine max]|nr:hypothetical protein GLYMA_16G061900v4 [Glycine max]
MGKSSLLLMSLIIICFFVWQLMLTWSRVLLAHERSHCSKMSIGAVLDLSSQMGKHQKIAMQIALQEFNRSSCSKLDLKIKNSQGNSAQTVASGNVNGNFSSNTFHSYLLAN